MVAACRNRKTRAQLLRRRRAQLRRRRAQLRRRRAQLLRSRRKHTIRRKIRHRKLLPKRRKQPLKQGKPGRKIVSKKPEPRQDLKRPYDEFVVKVLQRLHRDKVPISTKAKGKMISFIRRFYNNVSDKAKCSRRCKESCTIGSRELQGALKRVMRKKQAMELVKTVRNVSRRH